MAIRFTLFFAFTASTLQSTDASLAKLAVFVRAGTRGESDAPLPTALRQLYYIGSAYRERYRAILAENPSSVSMSIISSNAAQTLALARAFAFGLYPGQSPIAQSDVVPPIESVTHKGKSAPEMPRFVPIISAERGLDVIFARDCPGLLASENAALNAALAADGVAAAFSPLFEALAAAGHAATSLSQALELCRALVLVPGTPAEQCDWLFAYTRLAVNADGALLKSKMHPMAEALLAFLEGKQTVFVLLGHADTLAMLFAAFQPNAHQSLLEAYRRADRSAPRLSMGASVAFEVTAKGRVRALYNGEALTLFKGKSSVSMRVFSKALRRQTDPNFTFRCANPQIPREYPLKPLSKALFFGTFAAVVAIGALLFILDVLTKPQIVEEPLAAARDN